MKLSSADFSRSGRLLISTARLLRAHKLKYCPICKHVLGFASFKAWLTRYDGLAPHCRDCEPKYRYEQYETRPADQNQGGKGRKRIKRTPRDLTKV